MTTDHYSLARDADGNPLEVPAGAKAWRVRRGGGRRGRPRSVFDNETGRQLEIPLDATIEAKIRARDLWHVIPTDSSNATFTLTVTPQLTAEPAPLELQLTRSIKLIRAAGQMAEILVLQAE